MQFFKKLFKNNDFWPLILVIFAGILASRTLIFQSGYFNMHDDLQMMRQLQMEKCFLDLQIPCRWVPDMGYGFGFPLFNFYPPLPYLVGEIFRVLSFSFVTTVKLTFALSIILSGVGMYYLTKEFFGRIGGVLSAVFYIWAPYHSVDVYVRGAMNEAWALTWFPFIFLTSYKLLISKKKDINKWIILVALSWFALLMSHNLMVMIFGPLFAVWCLFWMYFKKKFNLIPQLIIPGILSLGLSAFFTFPAVLENKYTWLKSQLIGYYDYTAHFVSIKQILLTRFWGYGPSVWGSVDDRMPFQIGHVHWILSILIFALTTFFLLKKKKKKERKKDKNIVWYMLLFLFFAGWFAAFMTHQRSAPIYAALPFLGLVQFSWRFLTLVTFSFSFLVGGIVLFFKNEKLRIVITAVLSLFLIIFNWNYFLPEYGKMGALTDEQKFSDKAWELQQTAGIYDYLPIWAKQAPREPMMAVAEEVDIENGDILSNIEITDIQQGTDWAKFKVKSDLEKTNVRISIFKYPGWKVYLDGKEIEYFVPEIEVWGRMWVEVPQGEHQVDVKFKNTFSRTVFNLISLASWIILVKLYLKKR